MVLSTEPQQLIITVMESVLLTRSLLDCVNQLILLTIDHKEGDVVQLSGRQILHKEFLGVASVDPVHAVEGALGVSDLDDVLLKVGVSDRSPEQVDGGRVKVRNGQLSGSKSN